MACVSSLVPFAAEYCPIVGMCLISSVCPPADEHLSCPQCLATVNNAAVCVFVRALGVPVLAGVELLAHTGVFCLIFSETARLLHEVAMPFCIPLAVYRRKGQHIFNRLNRLTTASIITRILFHQYGKNREKQPNSKSRGFIPCPPAATSGLAPASPTVGEVLLPSTVIGVNRTDVENSVPRGLRAECM